MVSGFDKRRFAGATRFSVLTGLFAAASLLAGCNSLPGLGGSAEPPPPVQQGQAPVEVPPGGAALGTGATKVAIILPLTQGGSQPSAVGVSLRNAAELAMEQVGQSITLIVKDDASSPAGARAAAEAAIQEGAQAIVGPLYAGNVREVGLVARRANKPVIAFSTDPSVAARGVYLLSFLVEGYVNRVVDYAADRGKKSIAAMAPESDYGNVAIAAFQQAAGRRGMRVVVIERYPEGNPGAAAQRIGGVAAQIDTLFIPEQANNMAEVSRALTAAGVKPGAVQILGTGVWADARVLKLPLLQGAWFSSPENSGFNDFATRYRAKFNSDPVRLASLAYDAVTFAGALAGAQRLDENSLIDANGAVGADGLFRLRGDGLNDRGLSVQQIRNGQTSIVSPAPRSFSGSRPGT